MSFLVYDTPLTLLLDRGLFVVDEYVSYHHVRATESEAERLREEGFRVETFAPVIGRAGWRTTDAIPLTLQTVGETSYWIIEFRGPVKPEWLHRMAGSGGVVIEILPPTGYIVRATADQSSAIREAPEVSRVTPYHPAFKLTASMPWGVLPFNATAFADKHAHFPTLLQKIQLTGAVLGSSTTTSSRHLVNVQTTPAQAVAIARIDEVFWIGMRPENPGFDMNKSASVLQSGENVAGTHDGNYSIWTKSGWLVNGSTQEIVICDTGLRTKNAASAGDRFWVTHPAFNDTNPSTSELVLDEYNPHHRKIRMYYTPEEPGTLNGTVDDTAGHGTPVAGIAVGDDTQHGNWSYLDGISYASKLFICDVYDGNVPRITNDLWNMIGPAYLRNATIASISLHTNETSAYTEPARQRDEIVWLHRNFTLLQSMGNNPQAAPSTDAMAKSALAIGNVENQPAEFNPAKPGCGLYSSGNPENVTVSSVRGPAADGRFKPNIVAPGTATTAPRVIGNYSCFSGTSAATPAAAGAAALIRDYFNKGFYPTGSAELTDSRGDNVSAALVRGMLMASSKDLDDANPVFPNADQGWGRILLDKVLYFAGEERKLLVADEWETRSPVDPTRNLTSGEVWSRTVNIQPPGDVRIFLSWSDHPAALEAGIAPKALVNDLDLEVEGPICLVLGPPADICNGNSFATGTHETVPGPTTPHDNVNVEEAVYRCRWPAGSPCGINGGTHTIRIRANTTSTSTGQPFALVITGNVTWT